MDPVHLKNLANHLGVSGFGAKSLHNCQRLDCHMIFHNIQPQYRMMAFHLEQVHHSNTFQVTILSCTLDTNGQ